MSNAIVSGKASTIEQGFNVTIRRGPSGGVEYERAWVGTREAVLARLSNLEATTAIGEINAYQAPGSAIAVIRARFSVLPSGRESIQESLSIRWNTATEPIHRNPAFITLSDATVRDLTKRAENDGTVPTDPTELSFFNLLRRGTNSYVVKLPVLTYTRVAPRNTGEVIDVSNSGKIVELASIPVESFFAVSNINLGVTSGGGFTAGWMLTADGDFLANGNAQLVETYEFGLFENDLYEFA